MRRWVHDFGRAALALALLGLSACGNKADSNTTPLPPLMEGWGNVTSPLSGGGLLTYSFTLEQAELDRLFATALQEMWVRADLTISGMPVGPVGLRFKGSDGTLKICFENGVQICPKASMKVKFDFVDPNKRFMGLKTLNFHSMMGDVSQLRERLACEMFRRVGVETSKTAHSFLIVNGQVKGLFSTVETLDGRFTKDRFNSDGNLYKEVWPVEVDPEAYTIGLETNTKVPDNTRIAMFAQALFASKTLPELSATLSAFTDVDQMLRYTAVDRAINNYDGFTGFYCNAQGLECTNHNYLWYQRPSDNRFLLVPWDVNDSFTVRTIFDKVPNWDVVLPPAECTNRFVEEIVPVKPPGCDLVFQGLAGQGRPAYDRALDKVLGVWDTAGLRTLIDQWAAEIAPGVANDPAGPGVVAWRASVETLKSNVAALRDRLEATRASKTVDPFGLAVPGPNGFDAVSDLAFQLALTSETNPNSGGVIELANAGALNGAKDVRFGFEFINEPIADPSMAAPFGQMYLPMAGGPANLSGLSAIRMKMAADTIRTIRVEIDSPKYGKTEFVSRYGWDVPLGKTPAEISFDIARVALPADATNAVPLADVLGAVSGLILAPQPRGRNDLGLLPAGKTDPGFFRFDDVTFDVP
jgi:spore coat protein H